MCQFADVYFLPTIEDNWSLVIPEAMACGLPVATSVYNGCYPELVHKGENGITFDTFDQASIIEALGYFHLQNLDKMGRQSIALEKDFDTQHCAFRVYEAIINDNKNIIPTFLLFLNIKINIDGSQLNLKFNNYGGYISANRHLCGAACQHRVVNYQ